MASKPIALVLTLKFLVKLTLISILSGTTAGASTTNIQQRIPLPGPDVNLIMVLVTQMSLSFYEIR